jgi:hypothetical protein
VTPTHRSASAVATTDAPLSALVLVRAASGRRVAESAPIDAASVGAHQAAPSDVDAAQRACRERGFAVGPYVGISFSITAPRSTFEQLFDVHIQVAADGDVRVSRGGRQHARELPLDRLPSGLRKRLEAVTFAEPVDLHAAEPMT